MRYNRHGAYENGRSIKNSRFPASLFAIYLIVLLLMTGIHTGLILSVADTGCGMDQTSLQHIFDKFYQGGHLPFQRRKRTGVGTGKTSIGAFRR